MFKLVFKNPDFKETSFVNMPDKKAETKIICYCKVSIVRCENNEIIASKIVEGCSYFCNGDTYNAKLGMDVAFSRCKVAAYNWALKTSFFPDSLGMITFKGYMKKYIAHEKNHLYYLKTGNTKLVNLPSVEDYILKEVKRLMPVLRG